MKTDKQYEPLCPNQNTVAYNDTLKLELTRPNRV